MKNLVLGVNDAIYRACIGVAGLAIVINGGERNLVSAPTTVVIVMGAPQPRAAVSSGWCVTAAGVTGCSPMSDLVAVSSLVGSATGLILAGGTYLPPHALNSEPLEALPAEVPQASSVARLTERQLATLRLAMLGKSNKVIAREMDLSEATVKAHLAEAFRRSAPRFGQHIALGEHQLVVLVQIRQRIGRVQVLVPGLQSAFLEGGAAAMHRHPHLAVPGRCIDGIDDRHRGAVIPAVLRNRQHHRPDIRRLGKHEVGSIRHVAAVVPLGIGADEPIDGAVDAEVEPDELAPRDRDRQALGREPSARRALHCPCSDGERRSRTGAGRGRKVRARWRARRCPRTSSWSRASARRRTPTRCTSRSARW